MLCKMHNQMLTLTAAPPPFEYHPSTISFLAILLTDTPIYTLAVLSPHILTHIPPTLIVLMCNTQNRPKVAKIMCDTSWLNFTELLALGRKSRVYYSMKFLSTFSVFHSQGMLMLLWTCMKEPLLTNFKKLLPLNLTAHRLCKMSRGSVNRKLVCFIAVFMWKVDKGSLSRKLSV